MSVKKHLNLNFPLLIDGGLSNVLEDLGCNLNNELWVANLLASDPDALVKTHLAYLKSGANIISTASYQATIPGFMKLGLSKEESESLLLKSVDLAEIAVNDFVKSFKPDYKPLIAGSIGPYGAYLADGSEYRGHYKVSDQELIDFHSRRIELLDNSSCDLLAFETIPSYQEAKVISQLAESLETPSWVSFSCKNNEQINDGTPINKVATLFKNHTMVFAIGVNCTPPKYISELIRHLKTQCAHKKILIYPNSGEVYDATTKTWSGISDPKIFFRMSKEWLKLGVDMIGGCCRIGPDHISQLHKQLSSQ